MEEHIDLNYEFKSGIYAGWTVDDIVTTDAGYVNRWLETRKNIVPSKELMIKVQKYLDRQGLS